MENKSKWELLDMDCLVSIFEKVGMDDLLLSLPFVCKSWYRASLQPYCWKVLDIQHLQSMGILFTNRFVSTYRIKWFSSMGLVKLLVKLGHGSSVKVILPDEFAYEELVYISDK
nr:TPA_asm: hypothetical protein HUJ06_023980 [Nelumbo nucifera]